MSLITRCPACSTLFKVVPDQLRISAGWVRCGQCGEVFDGAASMLPYEQTAQIQPVSAAPKGGTAFAPTVPASLSSQAPVAWHGPIEAPADGIMSVQPDHEPVDAAPARTPEQGSWVQDDYAPRRTLPPDADAADRLNAQIDWPALPELPQPLDSSTAPNDGQPIPTPAGAEAAAQTAEVAADPGPHPLGGPDAPLAEPASEPAATDAEPAPSFVARARRRAYWSSRPVRMLLWLGMLVLLLGLALQVVLSRRDWLAAREPGLAPVLQALCQPLGCRVEPYRQLESIVIDSSSFSRVGPGSFRFSVALRNNADLPVASPALELTLTDAQDQVLARRVVRAQELGAPPALAARGEFSATHALTVTDLPNAGAVVGYRLFAFYP